MSAFEVTCVQVPILWIAAAIRSLKPELPSSAWGSTQGVDKSTGHQTGEAAFETVFSQGGEGEVILFA